MPSNIPASPSPAPLTPIAVSLFEAARVLPVDRDRWLAAGFEPSTALNFLSAGATLEAAIEWRADSLSANDFARFRSLAGAGLGSARAATAAWRNAITIDALEQIGPTLDLVRNEHHGWRRALRIEDVDGEAALDFLNHLDAMQMLDPRTPVQLNNWELVAVRGMQGERWWLPTGIEPNSLPEHGDGLHSFGDAYFTRLALDRFPRALGRHQSVTSALTMARSRRPLVQVAVSWGRRTLGTTGIVWDIADGSPAGIPGYLLVNDEYERAQLVGEHLDVPHLAPIAFSTLDDALAQAGRASFVVDGLLLVSVASKSPSTLPPLNRALRSLVPVDSFEFALRGSGRPAFMLDGQDYLAVSVEADEPPVLLPVVRHDNGIVDPVTVFDRHLATFSETNPDDGLGNWFALGVTSDLVVGLVARQGEAPRAYGWRSASTAPELVATWLRQLVSMVDAPDGLLAISRAALAADGSASGETYPVFSDEPPFRSPESRSPVRAWFNIDLDDADRLRCADDLRAHQ